MCEHKCKFRPVELEVISVGLKTSAEMKLVQCIESISNDMSKYADTFTLA